MTGTRAAIRYAKAVLDSAKDQNELETVHADMRLILNTITQSKDLQGLLKSPIVKSDLKKSSLKEIFTNTSSIAKGLIDVLIDNKRVDLLDAVAEKYITLYDQLKGRETAIVTTAIPLTDVLKEKVLAKIKALTKNDVTIENRIDKNIIGGFILRIGDLQYNASIANKLSNLKRVFNTNFDRSTMS